MPLEESSIKHHPGVYKQQNKAHKHGRHRSKSTLEILNKGRVNKIVSVKKIRKDFGRETRRNQALQLRKKKKEELLKHMRRLIDAPLLVVLIAVSDDISYFEIVDRIKTADSEATINYSGNGYVHVRVPRFKQRFTFVLADTSRIYHTLDLLKVADAVIFLTSVNGLSENGDIVMTCVMSQGLPNTVLAVTDLQTAPLKKRHQVKQSIQENFDQWLPDEKVISLETENDVLTMFRKISSQKLRTLVQRDMRPYLLTEEMNFTRDDKSGDDVLIVSGYLRGATLSVNDLVHIPGWKDFKLKKLEIHPDPLADISSNNVTDNCIQIFHPDCLKQPSLESENVPDEMDAEQTWPTEEELKEANKRSTKMKKVPKGFSEYQAAWIVESDEDDDGDDDDVDDIDAEMNENDTDIKEMSLASENDDEDEVGTIDDTATVTTETMDVEKYDKNIDLEDERREREKIKDAKEDKLFPDEVDTPLDIPARVRFQKYRGLKSFRTSPWDSKENLPADYARIFQFENFARTKKRVLKEIHQEKIGAPPGYYVKLYLEGVTEMEYTSIDRTSPLVVIGMLPHEQKMSVVNIALKQPNVEENKQPIKSKEELIFQCGYRRFKSCPIFSQHAKGNIHKYERYFQPDAVVVATVFAPIIYPPCAVLVFKELKDSTVHLVATGSMLSTDPNRIVVKRTVLSGYPLKVNKKSAVIRFMFHNREDVLWFKPVELQTKYGRRGHIKEPLGTHGHMKCIFDSQLKSQDTVLLNLYKRVFPKWTYSKLYTTINV